MNEPEAVAYGKEHDPGHAIALEVRAERARQDAKWGEQNHPDGVGPGECITDIPAHTNAARMDRLRAWAITQTDAKADDGTVTWRDILLEEVFEALAEDDLTALRTELIQVAAVAQQWAQAIDRRSAR